MPETETAKKSSCGCSGHSAHASPATDTTNQTGHIDPVCGMTVIPEKAAASHLFEGTTYYFCNPGCKTRFAGNEEYYLTGKHKEDAAKAAAEAAAAAPAEEPAAEEPAAEAPAEEEKAAE